MSRKKAIQRAENLYDSGTFFNSLSELIACKTDGSEKAKNYYLVKIIAPRLEAIGFTCRIIENKVDVTCPFLIANRLEDEDKITVLSYGHGDTVPGMDDKWASNRSPWELRKEDDRWFGRGSADNKGQHLINFTALECILEEKGELGVNVVILLETGEESGSPGLQQLCEDEKIALQADLFIASDGPRIHPEVPTIFGGSRGVFNFDISVELRGSGHHSGNWGGLLANPGILLSHAIASMIDKNGKILIPELNNKPIPQKIRDALLELEIPETTHPKIDKFWGGTDKCSAEKVYGQNSFDVLAFECGNTKAPVHAIPPKAWARCHIRFTKDYDPSYFERAIRKHLDAHGFTDVKIGGTLDALNGATRMDPDNPWVEFTLSSFRKTMDQKIAFLPNLGGSLPNDTFSQILNLPTIWVPHSYSGCCQHAPDEHLLGSIVREGLQLMTGLFWDLSLPRQAF